MVVGRLLSYLEGNFSGAMLNFGRVIEGEQKNGGNLLFFHPTHKKIRGEPIKHFQKILLKILQDPPPFFFRVRVYSPSISTPPDSTFTTIHPLASKSIRQLKPCFLMRTASNTPPVLEEMLPKKRRIRGWEGNEKIRFGSTSEYHILDIPP